MKMAHILDFYMSYIYLHRRHPVAIFKQHRESANNQPYYSGDQISEDVLGWACGTCAGEGKYVNGLGKDP